VDGYFPTCSGGGSIVTGVTILENLKLLNTNMKNRKKYRIPRKQKKREKSNLTRLTDNDMRTVGKGLTKKEKNGLKYERWRMLGVVYHKYNFTK
jgi:uncharacterized protein YjeT (DUF2065 family)